MTAASWGCGGEARRKCESIRFRHDRPRRRDGRILELLEGAGLVEVYVDADGKQAMRLTEDGGVLRGRWR